MYRMLLLFSLPCSCKVLDLYFVVVVVVVVVVVGIFMKYLLSFSSRSLLFLFYSNLMFAYMLVGGCDVL